MTRFDARDDSIHHVRVSVVEAGLQRLHRVRADDFSGILDLHAKQTRGARKKRFGRDADAGSKHSAHVFAARGDHVKINRRAEIHDDARAAVFRERRDGVDDPVRAHFLRIVVQNGHAGFHARLDEQGLHAKIPLGHFLERGIERRHNRADDHAADRRRIDSRQSKKFSREDAVLIDGLIARRREPPVRHEFRAAEKSEDRVRVSDIQRQQHQSASERVPAITGKTRPSSRLTRRSPEGSSPSVVPV